MFSRAEATLVARYPCLRTFLAQGGFERNVLVLAGGTAAGQFLTIVAAPLVTRIYSPHDYGLLSVFVSMLTLLTIVGSWSYEKAIPLPREDETAANVVVLCLVIATAMAVLSGVGVAAVGGQLASRLNAPELGRLLYVLPLSVLTVAAYQTLSYWVVRKGQFGALARTKLTQSIWQVVVQVTLGIANAGAAGLVVGEVAGRGGGGIALGRLLWKESKGAFEHVSIAGLRKAAVRYRKFPLVSNVSGVLSSLGSLSPVIILGTYGAEVAGWFAFCNVVVGAPLDLISVSVSRVYLNRSALIGRSEMALQEDLFRQIFKRLSLVVTPILLVVVGGAPWLFPIVFGERWAESATYLLVLAPMYLFVNLCSPMHAVLDVLERQDIRVFVEILRGPLVLGPLLLASTLGLSPMLGLALYSLGTSLFYLCSLVAAWHVIRMSRLARSK